MRKKSLKDEGFWLDKTKDKRRKSRQIETIKEKPVANQ
jgi:hypothetical protein